MNHRFPEGTASPFARSVAAEVRALLAAHRVGLRQIAAETHISSHNYLAIRLRDEKPLTLDDVDAICQWFDIAPKEFIGRAVEAHYERFVVRNNERRPD